MVKANIMVTGGTGFIGSHLVEELLASGYSITVPYIDVLPKSYFTLNKFKKDVALIKLDICDKDRMSRVIHKNKIEYIFHLAAQTIVTHALKDPYYTLYNNTVSTINLLEEVRVNKQIKGIIIASSDKAYGKTDKAYTEKSPLKGDHPYDVSKSATDLFAQTYFKTYKTPVVVTRFANVYGEGDLHMSRIVPGICESLIKRQTLPIRSDGKFVRDYIYVKDVVSGYLFLFHNLKVTVGNAFNISSKDSLSVIEVIRKAQESSGKKLKYSIKNTAVNEIPYQHLNDRKIRVLGWRSQYKFNKVFPKILEWYQEYVF